MEYFIYILRCCDSSYYVGHTDNLTERIKRHNSGCGMLGLLPDCRCRWSIMKQPLTSKRRLHEKSSLRNGLVLRKMP